ncbi:hypothetical protein F7725_022087, partial [Dissostichus mawsoni]
LFTEDSKRKIEVFRASDGPKSSHSQSVNPPVCPAESSPLNLASLKKNVLQLLYLEVENRLCCTSYISGNRTDKPEKMRWSCAFWFCGEERKNKKSMLHGSISRSTGGRGRGRTGGGG